MQVVCSFCEKHLEANQAAFKDSRLQLIIDDARAQLEKVEDASVDIIIGDLADPVFGGPCYQVRGWRLGPFWDGRNSSRQRNDLPASCSAGPATRGVQAA